MRTHRFLLALLAIVAAVSFTVVAADARSSGSSGSRGSRTFSAPPPTATAPRNAAPMQRTITQPNQARPNAAATAGSAARPGGFFGGGLLGGLAAGFLGAGLFGMLFGHGFMGGLGGFASVLGLLIQIGIVVLVARLAWAWWQRRNQPAYASGPALRDNHSEGAQPNHGGGGFGGFGGFGGSQPESAPLEVSGDDFNDFERLLGEIQTAYSNEDVQALRSRLTPEMMSYFVEEMTQNSSQGVVNKIADLKLLQGDLSEAWREGNDEYATVAMRYSLNDTMVDRASGKVLQIEPSEATELWTFRRANGGQWILSAIQQTS
jgi:predicted lipid-binding transport protein (Tim44 family)